MDTTLRPNSGHQSQNAANYWINTVAGLFVDHRSVHEQRRAGRVVMVNTFSPR